MNIVKEFDIFSKEGQSERKIIGLGDDGCVYIRYVPGLVYVENNWHSPMFHSIFVDREIKLIDMIRIIKEFELLLALL